MLAFYISEISGDFAAVPRRCETGRGGGGSRRDPGVDPGGAGDTDEALAAGHGDTASQGLPQTIGARQASGERARRARGSSGAEVHLRPQTSNL